MKADTIVRQRSTSSIVVGHNQRRIIRSSTRTLTSRTLSSTIRTCYGYNVSQKHCHEDLTSVLLKECRLPHARVSSRERNGVQAGPKHVIAMANRDSCVFFVFARRVLENTKMIGEL